MQMLMLEHIIPNLTTYKYSGTEQIRFEIRKAVGGTSNRGAQNRASSHLGLHEVRIPTLGYSRRRLLLKNFHSYHVILKR